MRPREEGTTAIEYAILGSLVAVVILGAVTALGMRVGGLFDRVVAAFG